MAPQLTGMNGAVARPLRWWTARATSSLPTPLSPVMSTVVRAAATFSITENTDCMAGLRPTICSNRPRSASRSRNSSLSCASWRFDKAALTSASISEARFGLFST